MNTTSFSLRDIFKESWKITIKHIWLFTAVFIAFLILYTLIQWLSGQFDQIIINPNENLVEIMQKLASKLFDWKAIVGCVFIYIVSSFYFLGMMKMSLNAKDGTEPTLADFVVTPKKIAHFTLYNIIYSVVVAIGLSLCILPGLLLMARLQFAGYFILEQDCNALDALSNSWEYTKGKTWKLCLFTFVFIVLIVVSVLLLLIGFFIAVPMTIVACSLVYRKLAPDTTKEIAFEAL